MSKNGDTTADVTQMILIDAFERVRHAVHGAAKGLSEHDLAFRPSEDANSIAWLLWHLTRVQDDHIAELRLRGSEQVWQTKKDKSWHKKFGLPFDVAATGYGHSSDEVATVQASEALLTGYYDDVHQQTIAYIKTLKPADYNRIVDRNWDPPVTLGVRLVSILEDDLQHAGQAAYIRGLL
jgi:hypothetical protein